MDYNTVAVQPACLSSLAALPVTGFPRKIEGVYELHSITALGLTTVLAGGGLIMKCCAQCKWQTDAENPCAQHPDAGIENPYIAKLSISDDTGTGEAMLYHEAFLECGLAPLISETEVSVLSIQRKLRNTPWSMRVVYRLYEGHQENYVEVKLLRPMLTHQGVISAWHLHPAPERRQKGAAVMFSSCADVKYDDALHRVTSRRREVVAVRL